MLNKKILNDPVYGFIGVPRGLVFELVEHPYFQRLRRIKQLSLTHYVYPGALHTRFHHALGALHLMTEAIEVLRSKGTEVTEAEAEAVFIAILLHDIGHGPYSHTLENTLINVSHEHISALFMEQLNEEFDGRLDLAIQIFKDDYKKKFLHQLVSSQLDMDRLDYLNRDSFFTGVHEGVIGYDRIIKMLAVNDGELVVEQKGIYSVEKFLIARRLMYWQVYLHKTVLSAEQMLIQALLRAKTLVRRGVELTMPDSLHFFISRDWTAEDFAGNRKSMLEHFALLDDHDIAFAIKYWMNSSDRLLSYLCEALVNRRLFRLQFSLKPFSESHLLMLRAKLSNWWGEASPGDLSHLLILGAESNSAYSKSKDEIKILYKDGRVEPLSMNSEYNIQAKLVKKYFLCHPKEPIR
ncbi:MAG TPA: HD domain-containing protein [Saprospiraceae bacterium]|nr:HD domain-containing protein [Saprospiraceae bacterium]